MNESQNANNTQDKKIKCLITDFDETFFRTALQLIDILKEAIK